MLSVSSLGDKGDASQNPWASNIQHPGPYFSGKCSCPLRLYTCFLHQSLKNGNSCQTKLRGLALMLSATHIKVTGQTPRPSYKTLYIREPCECSSHTGSQGSCSRGRLQPVTTAILHLGIPIMISWVLWTPHKAGRVSHLKVLRRGGRGSRQGGARLVINMCLLASQLSSLSIIFYALLPLHMKVVPLTHPTDSILRIKRRACMSPLGTGRTVFVTIPTAHTQMLMPRLPMLSASLQYQPW